jgi:glycosyltransferase involved in cell wall biosynthesis
MILNWYGPVFDQSGYAVITRGMLFALDKLGVDIRLKPAENWSNEIINFDVDDKRRLCRMASKPLDPRYPIIMHQRDQGFNEFKKRYCYTLFETDRLPKVWIEGLEKMDKVFTFSKFITDKWYLNGFKQNHVKVLPFGVNKELFNLDVEPMKVLNAKKFIFVSNGDFTERKNFELLIQAYLEEFKANEEVTLILKVHYGGFNIWHKNALENKIRQIIEKYQAGKSHPQILVLMDKINYRNIAKLYRGANCYVTCSRGEGIGLPVVEAMACGCPVIVPSWGSFKDYIINGLHGVRVTGKEEIIDNIEYIKKCPNALNHKWFEVDKKNLKKNIRWAFENKEYLKKQGLEALKDIEKKDWHYTALEIIKEIF